MADDPRPRVDLSWTALFCAEHSEPFRAEWPRYTALATVGIFNAAVRDPRIQEACGTAPSGKADAHQLNRVLREFGPICCFLDANVVREVTMLAKAGLVWGHDPK